MAARKQKEQKPPAGIIFIADYKDPETGEVEIPGIASRLGITPSTYRKWLLRGQGPATFKLGKRRAAYIDTVNTWIADVAHAGTTPLAEEAPPEPKKPRAPHGASGRGAHRLTHVKPAA